MTRDLQPPKKIVLLAGEASGDILGAGLMRAFKRRFPSCVFEGIGGPLMIAEGFRSLYPMERLSVMGLVDPLLRLPELLSILRKLKKTYINNRPDMFIGIDSPDFNLRLEKSLKAAGIYTVHYVSPSVWAWRQGRIKSIKKSVDLMLTLFPFEAQFYRDNDVAVSFVGHPLADDIPLDCDIVQARTNLKLDPKSQYIALMPGSRKSEVENLLPIMHDVALAISSQIPGIHFLLPAANASRLVQIREYLAGQPIPNINVYEGQSHDLMMASDLVIMASGTTTLEAMLLKKPMVVCYKMSTMSYAIISRLVKIPYVALPNLLAKKFLVPEFIQDKARSIDIAEKSIELLENEKKKRALQLEFKEIHLSLKKNASEKACESIVNAWRCSHE